MNTQKLCRNSILIAVLVSLVLWTIGCSKTGGAGKDPNVDYYTCTMHPSVKSQDPKGKCPICSMDLVPVMKKAGSEATAQTSPQMQGMKGGREKQGGRMEGMPGMPGMRPGGETQGAQPHKFVVP